MRLTVMEKIAGAIGRRYWLRRIDAALHEAYRSGHIDTWTLHEIDGKAKYHADPSTPMRRKCPACFNGGGMHIGGTGYLCKSEGCRAPASRQEESR